jgi:ribosome-associated protein
MKQIFIKDNYITLGQFLKLSGCISSGGQAKSFIQDTTIYVNGIEEKRRGRKVIPEDIISVMNAGEFKITNTEM